MVHKVLKVIILIVSLSCFCGCRPTSKAELKIFDAHLHGTPEPESQLKYLVENGVYTVAISTSWRQQQNYLSNEQLTALHGMFVPCPNGLVPYSQQPCFENGKEWPNVNWVELQIKEGRIDFIGEVLTQYQGISMSDTLMYPYYSLAEKYNLPVGIHSGSAGEGHGCPNFKEEMGNPVLLKSVLQKFPGLKIWLMHGGGPYVKECIEMMKVYPRLYTDISVLNNTDIIPAKDFSDVMGEFIGAGLEDRIMFGSDNADIKKTKEAIEELTFLSATQKQKIFFKNAEIFFSKRKNTNN